MPSNSTLTKVSRRRLLKTALAATVTCGFSLVPFRRINAQAKARQGLALCIGLNHVNPRSYAGWNGTLAGCINDSIVMENIAHNNGFFDVKRLNDSDATLDNVRRHIAWAANDLRSGDIFMVSISSHGGTRVDTNGDEEDGQDETWCLWDGQWVDDDRGALWTRFAPGVRILVVGDLCHSGTTEKAIQALESLNRAKNFQAEIDRNLQVTPRDLRANPHPQRGLIEAGRREITNTVQTKLTDRLAALRDLWQARAADRGPAIRDADFGAGFNLPNDQPSPIRAINDQLALFLSQTQTDRFPAAGESSSSIVMRASGILLAACQDSQTSLDGDRNGVFTDALARAWNAGQFQGDYDAFFRSIQHLLQSLPTHQPNKDLFGSNQTQFNQERVFSVQ
jgi:hypothetical protein